MARPQPAHDLTAATGLTALSGKPVMEVADATLKTGRSLLRHWDELEPIVGELIKKVRRFVEEDEEADGMLAARLLSLSASVVQKIGVASTSVLRTSEGLHKLGLLLDAGRPQRQAPKELTRKQLVEAVIQTAKSLSEKGKPCPLCHQHPALEVAAPDA